MAAWEQALHAFPAEKERHSGSRRTVEGYSRMLQHFFSTVGKPPGRVNSQEVLASAYGKGLSGKEPSPVTIGARLAFYRCLTGIAYRAGRNPANGMQWRMHAHVTAIAAHDQTLLCARGLSRLFSSCCGMN